MMASPSSCEEPEDAGAQTGGMQGTPHQETKDAAEDMSRDQEQTGESCQGPHPWRKRLKPIKHSETDTDQDR